MFNSDRIQQKLFIIMGALIIILAGLLFYNEYQQRQSQPITNQSSGWEVIDTDGSTGDGNLSQKNTEQDDVKEEDIEQPAEIKVYLIGQVKNPGVISLYEGDRLEDAIHLAGGILEEADLNRINLALRVKDEGMYYIPQIDEEIPDDIQNTAANNPDGSTVNDKKVNINLADTNELQTLNRIGPVTAEKIIDYREKNGEFESIEEIMDVSGIGEKTFEGIKDDITVN